MEYIKYKTENRIAFISLDRPEKRNALNTALVNELKECLKTAETDSEVKIIILKGRGKAFCAGADLASMKQLQSNSLSENLKDSQNLAELYKAIYLSPKIVIAQLTGHAIAGGAGLAAVCDFIYSVPEAKYGYTETAIGFVPAIVSIFLLRKIGETKAKELLLTGKIISAEEAKAYGIFNEVFPAEIIEEETLKLAKHLAEKTSGDSLRLTKKLINKVQGTDLETALNYAANLNAEARSTPDCKRGVSAFLNKKKIIW
jgi:methylglutaconyl-CoA hydratase